MYSKGLLIITLAFAVSGQSSSTVSRTATTPAAIGTPPPISPCILQCVDLAAAQNHCTGVSYLVCLCASAQVQADANLCLTQHCSVGDQATIQWLQTSVCSANLTATGPKPTPKPVSFTSSAVSATGTGTTASKAASTGLQAGAGALFGAILVGVLAL